MSVTRHSGSSAILGRHSPEYGVKISPVPSNKAAMDAAVELDDIIYLDNNASTAPQPEVLEVVAAALRDLYANPSSQHPAGRRAAAAIELAREQVAALISCAPRHITFTSGATEAAALAIA